MPEYRVRVKPGYQHDRYEGGDETVFTEQELAAFGDKVTVLGPVEVAPDPEAEIPSSDSDDELKARAKEAGIKYYWAKNRETLLDELEALNG